MRFARSVIVFALVGGGLVALAPSASAVAPPYVRGNETVPTYSYAGAIHESVYVTAPFDSDHDGTNDTLAIDVIRPATDARTKVPVIVDASPYYACCGRGNESELKTYDAAGTIAKMPLFYDNYFVPRGYAVAGVDLIGTSRSTGCEDVGGNYEVMGAKTAIDWFAGRIAGHDATGHTLRATWSSGQVGMIGKSWDASIANRTAATGVAGLKTIVPISGISSWYDYERFNGVLRSPGYPTFLNQAVSGRPAGACDAVVAANQVAADDATGNYNAYWAQRNFRPDASKIKASVFLVHGINDLNVTTNQFASWWSALDVPKKIWLSQDGHVDPFDYRRAEWVDTLHQWFDHWLQGLDNGITARPQASVQNQDGTWRTQSSWPASGTASTAVPLTHLGGTGTRSLTDDPTLTESKAVSAPATKIAGRTVFVSGPLPAAARVAGSPTLTLRVKVDRPNTELTARLVDYGNQRRVDYLSAGEGVHQLTTQSCYGQSTAIDDGCYFDLAQDYVNAGTDILARGWQDAAHHNSLARLTPLTPGAWYSITIPIDATDARVASGHRLALVLTASDTEYTSPATTRATITIDPASSTLNLPVTGSATIPSSSTPVASTQAIPATSPVNRAHPLPLP